ncbi:MAG: LptA/OstA family protein [Candidatus Omnitrophica bacterium]|nr:LptA/OstA family protein [Candidatus Omnitrophota bacterium]
MRNSQSIFNSLRRETKTKKIFLPFAFLLLFCFNVYAQGEDKIEVPAETDAKDASAPQPIIINADNLEFSTGKKEIVAIGNVEVDYKGTKLNCQKMTVNNETKDAEAIGNVRLEDASGVIEGERMLYNFGTSTGVVINSQFRTNPYFGRAEKTEKVSELEIVNTRGYFTSCSYDNPHYRIKSRKMNLFPGDKVQTKDDTFYVGQLPLLYLPQLNRSLRDPLMHVQVLPGSRKDWGLYFLSAWRYNLTEDVTGRLYLDWRENMGVGEGFGVNYHTVDLGKGDFKFYYTQERNKSKDFNALPVDAARVFQRYLIRWRHKWDVDPMTNLITEYWKITDSKQSLYPNHNPSYNFLKEYWYREYEQDALPLSYVSVHHAFAYGAVDLLMQPRINRWYDEVEKVPEIKYSLPSFKVASTPFYFDNQSSLANFNHKHPVPSASSNDIHSTRFDTTNKFALPMKIAFIHLSPSVQHRGTYYTKNIYGAATVFRTIFSTGAEASTKFYRIFNLKTNFLGLNINSLRHVITPTVNYSYSNEPTVSASKLVQIDSVDSISGRSNSAALELSNILQTKRDKSTVQIADFRISSIYTFKTKNSRGSNLGDVLLKLDILPYSWVRIIAEATYNRTGVHDDPAYGTFTNVNYDIDFGLGAERSFGFSQRYNRKGPNEFVADLKWRISPKWRFSIYQRFVTGHRDPSLKRGLREQEYVLSRDLHCWIVDLTYNITRDIGESIFIAFRLKAFPEMEFNYNQEYHKPKPGELSY